MKHLEESNQTAAAEDAEELAEKNLVVAAKAEMIESLKTSTRPKSPTLPVIPKISLTEPEIEFEQSEPDSESEDYDKIDEIGRKREMSPDVSSSPIIFTEPPLKSLKLMTKENDKLYCQIPNTDLLLEQKIAKSDLNSKKLVSQKTFEESVFPPITQNVIYEESSDSDNQHIRQNMRDSGIKKMGQQMKNHRAYLLQGMRIDSIEDREGSSSPPYDDRASESQTSLNDFYSE